MPTTRAYCLSVKLLNEYIFSAAVESNERSLQARRGRYGNEAYNWQDSLKFTGLTDIITKDPDFNKDQKYVKDNFRLACANGPRLFRDSSGNHYPFLGVQNSLLFILNGMAKKSVGGTGEDRISLYPKQLGKNR